MKISSISAIALVSLSQLASGYAIKGNNINCRSGPGTSYGVVRSYSSGDDVTLSCQTEGESIKGDSLWDKTQDGCYVADYYVKTGTSSYVADKCGASGGNTGNTGNTGSTSNTGSTGGSGFCRTLNSAAVSLIKEYESSNKFVAAPSPDPIGLPTVGFGHRCQTKGCGEVKYGFPLSQSTADALLNDDIPAYSSCLATYLKSSIMLNDNQWGALTSWVFNVGCSNAKSSTLIRRLNAGENPGTVAAQELPKWRLAGGRVFDGLVRRRNAEISLFNTPSSKLAFPNCQ
ncbi:family 24 glycoside hydrolase [Linderina pennispora]|uniref:Family 24 glycoside hydrolase n=1 Tax=Linderina pennispora TaxID=61395 RepID=A0A1Y1VR98_9FUNG|nr:family 24 glycoside hydrolase [Linderina pennispora]XP_040739146.1 family 24 glycoside hydrolase [Linderina pennispora]ORX63575.1 family 24 glycoside hydrolase [Linderina pennispora]ORX64030.1 family 24 glycoside hydrolase [Linderina pennispora]